MSLTIYLCFAALALMIDAGLTIVSKRRYLPLWSILLALAWPLAVLVTFLGAIRFSSNPAARDEFLKDSP